MAVAFVMCHRNVQALLTLISVDMSRHDSDDYGMAVLSVEPSGRVNYLTPPPLTFIVDTITSPII